MKYSSILFVLLAFFGITASGKAQGPTWTNDAGVSNVTDVYTANGRPGVASAFFNNQIWVAYASTSCSYGCYIKLASSTPGYTPLPAGALSFSTPTYVYVPGSGDITSYNTPSLTVQNGYLYLAWNDAGNNNWLTSSTDGINWQTAVQLTPGYTTTWGPSLAADPFNTGRIYVGYADGTNFTPIICAVYPYVSNLPSSTQTCEGFTSLQQMNFGPGLIYWTGTR